jgi:hypothetical protein
MLYARPFLCVESGECIPYMQYDCLMIDYTSYSMLPALSLDRILYVDIVEGSFNTGSFAAFIEGLLEQMNPYPQLNSVIGIDNCCIHKCPDILDMIKAQ